MRLEDFDFELPPEYIAQKALRRGASRLLILPRREGAIRHTSFSKLPDQLGKGDCLIYNDTKVIPARFYARKLETHAKIEFLLHREVKSGIWEALARPGKRLSVNTQLRVGNNFITVAELLGQGRVLLHFQTPAQAQKIIQQFGITPLPPYIRRGYLRPNSREKADRRRYQTIFASQEGSVAAPTAGLHFSPAIVKRLKSKGVKMMPITLHIGWGTFVPLTAKILSEKALHPEFYYVPPATVRAVHKCRQQGGRVIACGTTVARTLEAATDAEGLLQAGSGKTELFIHPGFRWQQVDGLLTNFHLPRSSLFVLVCAFSGIDRVRLAYKEAVAKNYRFYSYGDAMFCYD